MAEPHAPEPVSPWPLDPAVDFLNHGSFGSCPRPVREAQLAWRERMERQPVQFFARDLEGLLDEARGVAARFLGCEARDLVFVANATTGVNAVLRSLDLRPGDELLTTDHGYNACRNALDFVAERSGARVVVAHIPFPLGSADAVVARVVERCTERTRLALLDHVTSPTGLVLPIGELVRQLSERGVDTLVDGAHAPGMLDLNLATLGAAYYTGNFHKWVCAPKGAAFLYVRRARQASVRPAVISHGANRRRRDRTRFQLEFDWTGTGDPTPCLCVPTALGFMEGLLPGGWPALRAANRQKVLAGRDLLCRALRLAPPAPDDMIGSLAAVPLPAATSGQPPASALYTDPLQDELLARHAIEVPIVPWPTWPHRLVRVSAQVYNRPEQYERLATALVELLGQAPPF